MEVSRYWRLQKYRYGLIGKICEKGHKTFPPRDICPDCADAAKTLFVNYISSRKSKQVEVIYEANEQQR